MTLVGAGEIVGRARRAGRGAAAFNVVQIEHAQAVVAGAERADAPVILQISENTARYHGALRPVGAAVLEVAAAARVPAAVHLDHATGPGLVDTAVDLGFGSVMYDASALEHDRNVAATAEIAARCHARGVWVEAGLGEIGGTDGVHDPAARTDPGEAAAYVAATGVDALAVAVGTSHAVPTRTAVLDLGRIAALRAAVPVPLVLHGSSGVPDEGLAQAVAAGITKVNVATRLNQVYTRAVRERLAAEPEAVDPRRYVASARDAVAGEVEHLLGVLGAADVMRTARWG